MRLWQQCNSSICGNNTGNHYLQLKAIIVKITATELTENYKNEIKSKVTYKNEMQIDERGTPEIA